MTSPETHLPNTAAGGGQAAEGANPPWATYRQGKEDLPALIFHPPPLSRHIARVKASESLPPRLPHQLYTVHYYPTPYVRISAWVSRPTLSCIHAATSMLRKVGSVVATPIPMRLCVHPPAPVLHSLLNPSRPLSRGRHTLPLDSWRLLLAQMWELNNGRSCFHPWRPTGPS